MFAELLAAEVALRGEGWSDPRWRRLVLAGGALQGGEGSA